MGMGDDPDFARTASSDTATAAESFSLTADATTSLQTLYIYAGISRSTATLNLNLSDNSATPVAQLFNAGNTFAHVTYKIDYFADAVSGETLNVSWDKTAHLGGSANISSIRFQAASLTVPEPSTGLLSMGALALMVLRRKR